MNVAGPQAFVTARNLERAIDPTLVPEGGRTGLDTGYLAELGDEAVVPVVDAWDRLGEADRAALAPALARREEQLGTDPSLQGWPAWNLTRQRAREALRAGRRRGAPPPGRGLLRGVSFRRPSPGSGRRASASARTAGTSQRAISATTASTRIRRQPHDPEPDRTRRPAPGRRR